MSHAGLDAVRFLRRLLMVSATAILLTRDTGSERLMALFAATYGTAAMFCAAFALLRRDALFGAASLTLWDEAAIFLAISLLVRLAG